MLSAGDMDVLPPRYGGAHFLRQTEDVPAPSLEARVLVSTINNALGCETAVWFRDEIIWRCYHAAWQDLDALHEYLVTVIRNGDLDLFLRWGKVEEGGPIL